MNLPRDETSIDRRKQIDLAAIEYESAIDRGESPDRERWIGRYPGLEAELQAYLRGRDHSSMHGDPQAETAEVPLSTAFYPPKADAQADPGKQAMARIGDYYLLEKLGAGGQGTVYRAQHILGHLTVALKVIASRGGEDGLQDEIRTIASLRHDSIMRIFSFGRDGGNWYYTMELMENGSLQDHLPDYCADPRKAAALLEKVARGVHYAHSRGILHLDLKPANVLLDGQGRPLVSDLGLAKRNDVDEPEGSPEDPGDLIEIRVEDAEQGLALTNSRIKGTPGYMSPEMASGAPVVTTAADVYGLGAILYTLLTSQAPFRGATFHETLVRVIEDTPVPPRKVNRKVDRELQSICLKCLRKDPAGRYGSADALANDLKRWANGEPTLVVTPTAGRHIWFWLGRHPLGVAAACMAGLVLWFSALAGSIGELHSANHREARRLALDVDRELHLIRRAIEIMARDPKICGLLAGHPADLDARRRGLEALLNRAAGAGDDNLFGIAGGSPLINIFVLDAGGTLLADSQVDSSSVGRNFSHRDYFRGLVDPANPPPRRGVYVARSYRSAKDSNYKVALSARVWDEDKGGLLGVLVANVTIGSRLIGLDMVQEAEGAVVTSPMDWSTPAREEPSSPPRPAFLVVLDRAYPVARDTRVPLVPIWPDAQFARLADFERDGQIEATDYFQHGEVLDYHRVGETPLVVVLRHPYPWPVRWVLGGRDLRLAMVGLLILTVSAAFVARSLPRIGDWLQSQGNRYDGGMTQPGS